MSNTPKTPSTPDERRELRERIRNMPVGEYIETRNQYLRESSQRRLRELSRPIPTRKERP